ncbi:MAG: Rpn family recombination-promoting nuclease/putative transposase [Planctomycetota bacterium]|nr:Rpn family recombination-promoting nuclease/putative transposase [Planctomycetota bacterium]
MNKKPLSTKNDFVFKKLFGENMAVPIDFLKTMPDFPDDESLRLEILDPNLRAENAGDKHCVLDAKPHTRSGHAIDIEIQVEYQKSIWNRIQFCTAKMLVERAKSGDDYESLPRAIGILIADFILIGENGEFHNRFRLLANKAAGDLRSRVSACSANEKRKRLCREKDYGIILSPI